MKLLNRVYIRNWHKIKYAIIPFEMLNFLTGKNTVGKSTVIDALQFILLGDKRGHYFNRAANDKSERSLKGYLFAQNGYSHEIGGFTYDREGHTFHTYLMAEFFNTNTEKYFTIGAVFNCDKYLDYDMRYFTYEDRIPDHEFVQGGKTMGIDAFKAFINQLTTASVIGEITRSEEKYQANIRKLFGNIKPSFFKLFRQAVPFSPIMDIKQFISTFISDVEEKVQVEHLRENIREYKRLEQDLLRMEKHIHMLESVESSYSAFVSLIKQERVEQYILDRAEADQVLDHIHRTLLAIEDAGDFITQRNEHHQWLLQCNQDIDNQYYNHIASNTDRINAWTQRENALKWAKSEETRSIEAENQVKHILENPLFVWSTLLEQIEEHGEWTESFSAMRHLLDVFNISLQQKPWNIFSDQLQALRDSMKTVLEQMRSRLHQFINREEILAQEQKTLSSRLLLLKNGLPAYENPHIVFLQSTIQKRLSEKYGTSVEVLIFCELLDIRNDEWKNAIEGYLNHQRFYLIIDPDYYEEALDIYEAIRFDNQIYTVGLVDIEKIIKQGPRIKAGSLAEEIVTDHPYGRAYADFLLGDVMKVSNVKELRRNPKSITASCMLYQGYVSKPLNPRSYRTPFIGRKSIEIRIKQCQEQLRSLSDELVTVQNRVRLINNWVNRDPITDRDIYVLVGSGEFKGHIWEANQREDRRRLVEERERDLALLDRQAILSYQETKERLEAEQQDLRKKITNTHGEIKVKENEITKLRDQIFDLEEQEKRKRNDLQQKYHPSWVSDTGEVAYEEALTEYKHCTRLTGPIGMRITSTKMKQSECFDEVVAKRDEYIRELPNSTLNVWDRDNDEWVKELEALKRTELTEYGEKISEAKERAQVQFQEDFISKLKSNIETINEQIIDLNTALQYASFGRHTYEFSVKENPKYKEYYDMIMDDMLMDGYTLFSAEFEARHGDARDSLFQQILHTGEEGYSTSQMKQLEENLARFTDCRTYLDFDLMEINNGKRSPLSMDMGSKSGGETQTPFYFAVLASFMHLYRVKSNSNSNTPRLVIFDEAFSKMDHQRIEQSLKLVKDMGLQLIISAPSDKINDITPNMDRTHVVVRAGEQTIVRGFDPKLILEEDSE